MCFSSRVIDVPSCFPLVCLTGHTQAVKATFDEARRAADAAAAAAFRNGGGASAPDAHQAGKRRYEASVAASMQQLEDEGVDDGRYLAPAPLPRAFVPSAAAAAPAPAPAREDYAAVSGVVWWWWGWGISASCVYYTLCNPPAPLVFQRYAIERQLRAEHGRRMRARTEALPLSPSNPHFVFNAAVSDALPFPPTE
jgi:hypothetical protein